MVSAMWLLFLVLLVAWLVGFAVNWGVLAWLLLAAALVVLLCNVVVARRGRRGI